MGTRAVRSWPSGVGPGVGEGVGVAVGEGVGVGVDVGVGVGVALAAGVDAACVKDARVSATDVGDAEGCWHPTRLRSKNQGKTRKERYRNMP